MEAAFERRAVARMTASTLQHIKTSLAPPGAVQTATRYDGRVGRGTPPRIVDDEGMRPVARFAGLKRDTLWKSAIQVTLAWSNGVSQDETGAAFVRCPL